MKAKAEEKLLSLLSCTYKTLTTWLDKYIENGLLGLTAAIRHKVACRLSEEHSSAVERNTAVLQTHRLWYR